MFTYQIGFSFKTRKLNYLRKLFVYDYVHAWNIQILTCIYMFFTSYSSAELFHVVIVFCTSRISYCVERVKLTAIYMYVIVAVMIVIWISIGTISLIHLRKYSRFWRPMQLTGTEMLPASISNQNHVHLQP